MNMKNREPLPSCPLSFGSRFKRGRLNHNYSQVSSDSELAPWPTVPQQLIHAYRECPALASVHLLVHLRGSMRWSCHITLVHVHRVRPFQPLSLPAPFLRPKLSSLDLGECAQQHPP